jgi:hypothetical protein
MLSFLPATRPGLSLIASLLCVMRAFAQDAGPPPIDRLIFNDGDQMSGECVRAEDGAMVFLSYKTGMATVGFDYMRSLHCGKTFAVLRKKMKVTRANAIIGRVELKDGDLVITPESGPPIALKPDDIAHMVELSVFLHEIAGRIPLHEGWSATASAGGALVRSTESSTALNTDVTLRRSIPGVDFLPRRRLTELSVRDSYDVIHTPDPTSPGSKFTSESHIFHADLEHNEYLHSSVYALANYSFDRNYAQGLLAQTLFGAGAGWTAIRRSEEQLDFKTDLHRETQGFNNPADNDTLFGQKFTIEYRRPLPRGLIFQGTSDYLAAYNLPHRYSANASGTVVVPLFRHFGISFTATDNYLNNPVPGLKHNAFRVSTNITCF